MLKHVFQIKPISVTVITLSVFCVVQTISAGVLTDPSTKHSAASLARRAIVADKVVSASAAAELRSLGPAGLQAFLDNNRSEIDAAIGNTDGSRRQVLDTLDSICQQRDCYASRLYWYTDLEQARSAARAQGKPILSLRLLGRLDEDLSCANSRLFRITLYANQQVSELLRERFILHWQSERPVPKLTIDFGDGRKMERTLTGNSIHYILDADGRVIDALPGLYGAGAFLRELGRISSAAATLSAIRDDEQRKTAMHQYHVHRLAELEKSWLDDVRRAGLGTAPSRELADSAIPGSAPPTAEKAAPVGVAKAVSVERPILRGMSDNPKLLDTIASDAGWSTVARMHAQDAALDQATLALMSFKDPSLTRGSRQYATIALCRAIAEDTVRNEYVYRTRILGWLARIAVASDVASLNEKIYNELFLTPGSDAWLGLRFIGGYSGIDNDGIRK